MRLQVLAALMAVVAVPAWASDPVSPAPVAVVADRAQISSMVGMDVSRTLSNDPAVVDIAAFEAAVRNALDGGKPLLSDDEARATGQALMQRIAARAAKQAPGTPLPAVDKVAASRLLGADVGRSLAPIKAEFDTTQMLATVRDVLAGGKAPLTEEQAAAVRKQFVERLRQRAEAAKRAVAVRNASEGAAFLAKHKQERGVFTTASGLQYTVLRAGSGARPLPTQTVRVNYRGTLLDGTEFDSSYKRNEPATFALNQVIAGWTEGVALMPRGSKYRFWVPSHLGYGATGTPDGSIGPNATLVFEVELLDIM